MLVDIKWKICKEKRHTSKMNTEIKWWMLKTIKKYELSKNVKQRKVVQIENCKMVLIQSRILKQF